MAKAHDNKVNLEVEIKFELTTTDMRKLLRSPRFRAMLATRPRTKTLRATYFDTPDDQLSARGLALRVRKEGRTYVQCLKADAQAASTTGFARLEWEWPVPGPAMDAALLRRDGDVMALLNGIKLSTLSRTYGTDIKRQTRELHTPGGAVLLCEIDQGRVLAGEREAPLYELELEQKSGDVGELLQVVQLITTTIPARLSGRTKAYRGFVLARGTGHAWVKADSPELAANATAEDVLRESVMEGLKHLIANEDCVLTRNHIEGVHQMRVALRRMRSVITTYKKRLPPGSYESLSQGLKNAGSALGPARDWDVFLAEVLKPVAIGFENDPDLALMHTRAGQRLTHAYRQADALIHSQAYAKLLGDALVWTATSAWRGDDVGGSVTKALEVPAHELSTAILAKRHGRLLRAGKGLKQLSIEHRHLLRITIKKVRYAAEFFAKLYPGKLTRPYLKGLKGLQESLGHLNDLATAERLMADLSKGVRGQNALALHRAWGRVEGWYMHAQTLREDDLITAWKQFSRTPVFWR